MARIPYPDETGLDPEVTKVLERMPARLNLFMMLAHAPSVMGPTLRLGGAILGRMELDAALRELAILRVAAVMDAPYEAHHHVPMARAAGVSAVVIAAAATPEPLVAPFPDGVGPVEVSVLRLVDETYAQGAATAKLLAELVDALGETRVVELVVTVGYYTMISQVLRSLDVDLDEGERQ